MSNDKFAALAEVLDVGDDTEAIERPDQTRPTVRKALESGRRTTHPDEPPKAAPAAPPPAARQPNPATRQPARVTGSPPLASATSAPTEPRLRSSVNLPVSLWKRVSAAKDDRWELSEILARSLQHPAAAAATAERRHRSMRDDLRVQRQYRVTKQDRDLLGRLADEWRMSRSEVVAVLLDSELDTMSHQP